jgi:MFS family permease
LAADMVYEGARSVTGPLLASLGASAVLVGLVSGAGEATALLLRVVFGSWADRSGRYWTLTFAGYALTAICGVPALAITPFLAGAGLAVACILILGSGSGRRSGARRRPRCWPMLRLTSDWDVASVYTRRSTRSALSRGLSLWRRWSQRRARSGRPWLC